MDVARRDVVRLDKDVDVLTGFSPRTPVGHLSKQQLQLDSNIVSGFLIDTFECAMLIFC